MQIFNPSSILDPALALREIEAEFGKCWNAIWAGGGTISFPQISGNIAIGQMASGSGASASTFWRGDGTWATPAGGGGGMPGGANTNVQFNNSSAFGGDSGFTYAGGGQATLAFGTVTANAKALNITGTWNNAAVTFDAPLFMNVTNTASAAGSLLADLQVGGTSQFSVDKTGTVTFEGGSAISHSTPGGGGTYTWNFTNQNLNITGNSLGGFILSFPGSVLMTSGSNFTFGGGNAIVSVDYPGVAGGRWMLDTAGILSLGLRLSAANIVRVYNTYTDASNYERGGFDWQTTPNVLRLRCERAGTGTQRLLAIDGFSKAGAPTTSDIPAGTWALVRDTSGSTTKLYYNNAGTLQSVALA